MVIDREEGIFLFQVCLCLLNAFSQQTDIDGP